MGKQKGRVAEPPKLVVTNIDKGDEKYRVEVDEDVVSKIRNAFSKEPIAFFLPGEDGIDDSFTMDKLHEKLPNGGSCKVRFGDKTGEKVLTRLLCEQSILKNNAEHGIIPPFYPERPVNLFVNPVVVVHGNPFVLISHISTGQRNFCYYGYSLKMQVVVFIKMGYCPSSSSDLLNEATILERLQNIKGVPKLLAFGADELGDLPTLVTGVIKGLNLQQRVAQYGNLASTLLVSIGQQVMSILNDIHLCGIVHRDIKPSNIIFGSAGVFLVDFEYSVPFGDSNVEPAGTSLFASLGTLLGKPPTPADDYESLIYTLNFLLVGHLPWQESMFLEDQITLHNNFKSNKAFETL